MLLLVIGMVAGLAVLYGSIWFYGKRAKGDYKELLATVVDFEFYTLHRERCGWLFSRFYRKVYQYTEDGEYKIYKGKLRSMRHTIIPVFLTKGKKHIYTGIC